MRALPALSFLVTLAALAVASGCSSNTSSPAAAETTTASAPEDLPPMSGTRLRAKLIVAGDARELVGFYDSLRKEDCTFQLAEDGRTRCLPVTFPYFPSGTIFADASCKTEVTFAPAIAASCDAEHAKYALVTRYDSGCGAASPAALRSVIETVSTTDLFVAAAGTCTRQTVASAGARAVAVGDVVPWDDFVEAVETVIPGASLSERILVASDGARQHLGFRIASLDAECTFQLMSDGQTRCVPVGTVGPVSYSDAACTKAAFVYDSRNGPCAGTTKLWLHAERSAAACNGIRAVYSLRDLSVNPSGTYLESSTSPGSPPTCLWSDLSGGYGPRRAIDVDLTPSLPTRPRYGQASGRLVPALVAQPGTQTLARGWHDTERGVDCTFTLASDGKLRCLPTGASAKVFFTDSACKSPSRVLVPTQSACVRASSPFARTASDTCPKTTRVYALGAQPRNLTNASNETDPGRCVQLGAVNNAFEGTEADPTAFFEGTQLTE